VRWLALVLAAIALGAWATKRHIASRDDSNPHAAAETLKEGAEAVPREAHVIVYTTEWCPVCKQARAWMKAQAIVYDERNVERSTPDGRAMRALNPRGSVPTFDIEGDVLIGFNEKALRAAVDRAASRRTTSP
jgi:glutaredoxin